jgi:hypothetical protein
MVSGCLQYEPFGEIRPVLLRPGSNAIEEPLSRERVSVSSSRRCLVMVSASSFSASAADSRSAINQLNASGGYRGHHRYEREPV